MLSITTLAQDPYFVGSGRDFEGKAAWVFILCEKFTEFCFLRA